MRRTNAAFSSSHTSQERWFRSLRPTIGASALALILVAAASHAAVADTISTPGDFTPSYNLDTTSPSGTAPDPAALQSQIDAIMNSSASQEDKEAQINTLVNGSVGGGSYGSCAEQLDPLLLGLDAASVATELARHNRRSHRRGFHHHGNPWCRPSGRRHWTSFGWNRDDRHPRITFPAAARTLRAR